MFANLQSWWQDLNPEVRTYALDGAVVLGALIGGHILGVLASRFLRRRKFDGLFRVTPPPPDYLDDGRGITPTMLAGNLVRLSIWAAAASWVARAHEQPEFAATLGHFVRQTWMVAGVLTAVLAFAGLLARRVIECLEGFTPTAQGAGSRAGTTPTRGLAGAVGAGIYGLVLILTLLTVADSLELPLTRTAALSLWQLALNLLIAGAALLVGILGARWAKSLTPQRDAAAHERVGQYTSLGIVAGTTVLAVALLLFTAGLSAGVAAICIAGIVLFFAQGHFTDVIAGLKLRREKVCTIWRDGVAWQVTRIGLLNSEVSRNGDTFKVQNRHVLEAYGNSTEESAPASATSR
jgi:hypothetical protein